MVISLDSEKFFKKCNIPFDEGLGERRDKRNNLNMIKTIYSKPTANIKLNGKKITENPL